MVSVLPAVITRPFCYIIRLFTEYNICLRLQTIFFLLENIQWKNSFTTNLIVSVKNKKSKSSSCSEPSIHVIYL